MRFLSVLLVVVLVAAGGLFYAAPVIAFYDIRSACQSQDVESLAKLVDFDSVRASLNTQLASGSAGVPAPSPSPLNDPLGAAGNGLKNLANAAGDVINALVNPVAPKKALIPVVTADDYLTPKALLSLTYGAGKDAPAYDPASYAGKPPTPHVIFFSLEHARLAIKDPDKGTTVFTFERHGITHWQLVHIGLPSATSGLDSTSSSASVSLSPAG